MFPAFSESFTDLKKKLNEVDMCFKNRKKKTRLEINNKIVILNI